MKKICNLIGKISMFLLLLFVSSCTDNDVEPLFEKSIKERTDEFITIYQDVLTKPDNGWVGYYSPNESFGAYAMVMKFDADGNVKINSDYDEGIHDNTITYRLDKTLKIEMVLESYSVFSEIFSLNDNANQGEFVFNILSVTDEEIILESKLDYGNDVTVWTLTPAGPTSTDFEPIYNSAEMIAGDGTNSVFRNILLNDDIIATFNYNVSTRLATVSYLKDDSVVVENAPIAITATGFSFLKPLVINETSLTSFTFNETENLYENTTDGLKIIYDNIPGLPLTPPKFEGFTNLRYNYVDTERSSNAFNELYARTQEDFTNANGGRTIYRFYLYNVLPAATADPYLSIQYWSGSTSYSMNYYLEREIIDGKMYFEVTGQSGNAESRGATVVELVDAIVKSVSGFYMKYDGTFATYTNPTVTMINGDNPKYAINYYQWGS
ncbi:DUF4302 domain-containing protein [Algibacter pacificus]|uniref:DUF4302 domain-containing protein n=1 Tax=Algibacter pacificus TaxID=2599389 RepID=UPI0011CBC4B2|nr:DUF4302 domain-containing protein [Algibacter pacificus]